MAVVVPAVLATGCGQAAGGSGPSGDAGSDSGGPPPSSSPAPSSPSASASGSSDVDPCAWLTPADRSTAGLAEPGQRRDVGGAPACDYTESGAGGVTITVDDTSGLSDLDTGAEGDVERTRIAGRDAARVADRQADDGTCAVLLGTGPGSSVHVDVSTADFSGTDASCTRATTVAELIAPELPGRAG